MFVSSTHWKRPILGALALVLATTATSPVHAAPTEKPVAGQQVRFPKGYWSALPQAGPDGKVRQCVLVALRQRAGKDGAVDTRFGMDISRGSGLVFTIMDNGLPGEQVLDDQAEIRIDGRPFPAVGFSIGEAFVLHPGDAAGALEALGKATSVTLRSDGAGIDTSTILLDLPGEALNWLKQCGKTFDIAIDKPTDPNAPDLPVPRPRSPEIAITPPTPAGPPGIEDKQKIEGWDASELRNNDGRIIICFIRRHYKMPADQAPRTLGIFAMASRLKGLTMMVKDSKVDLPPGKPVEATLTIGTAPFPAFSAQVLGHDEVGIFPQHGAALAAAIEKDSVIALKTTSTEDRYEFSVHPGVIGWLRACARRNGIAFEPAGQ